MTKDLDIEVRRIERQFGTQRKSAKIRAANARAAGGATTSGGITSVSSVREKRDLGQRISLLENRLDGVMINFNATLSQNALIRKDIDHLVQERTTFNDMIGKFQKKIGENFEYINLEQC